MHTPTIITHDGKSYEIVPCLGDKCSFLDLDCDITCNCPGWWKSIHTDVQYGLRALEDSEVRLSKIRENTERATNAIKPI